MNIGDLFFTLRASDAQLQADVQKAGDKAGVSLGQSLSQSIKKSFNGQEFGKGLVQGLGLAGGLGAAKLTADAVGFVKDALVDTVDAALEFQKGMLNVQSITKGTEQQLSDMGDTVLALSGEFGQSAKTMTDALYDISSSGFQGADALKVLEAASMAATAGLSTTGEAASGITAVLNAYNLSAEDAARVSDVMFQTVNRGVVTFPELSAVIGTTTALAAPLGVSLEEVGAGLAVMTRAGIDAENATTQLNAIMQSMLKPSAEAAALAHRLGIDWSAAGLKANGLTGTLTKMLKATKGNQEQMATLLGDARAIRGAFVLAADGGAEFTDELKIMNDAAGETADAFGVQSKGAAFQLAQAKAQLEAAGIEIGEKLLPVLAELAQFTKDEVVPAVKAFADVLGLLQGRLPETEEGTRNLIDVLNSFPNPLSIMTDTWKSSMEEIESRTKTTGQRVAGSVNGIHTAAQSAARHTRTAATAVGNAIEEPITKGAEAAERGVYTSMATIVASVEATRKSLTEPAAGLADAIFGPIEAAAAVAETKAELAEQRRIIADTKSTKDQVREAKARTVELQKQLLIQQANVASFGDTTARIAGIKALLTSKAVTDAYKNATPDQKRELDAWTTTLRLTLDTMERDAAAGGGDVRDGFTGPLSRGAGQVKTAAQTMVDGADGPMKSAAVDAKTYGYNTGKAYADGLRKTKGLVNDAAHYVARGATGALEASSPPGPESPLHEIDIWGFRTGAAYAEGFGSSADLARKAAIAVTRGIAGGLGSWSPAATPFAAPGSRSIGAPQAAPMITAGAAATYVQENHVEVTGLVKARNPFEISDAMERFQRTGVLQWPEHES